MPNRQEHRDFAHAINGIQTSPKRSIQSLWRLCSQRSILLDSQRPVIAQPRLNTRLTCGELPIVTLVDIISVDESIAPDFSPVSTQEMQVGATHQIVQGRQLREALVAVCGT